MTPAELMRFILKAPAGPAVERRHRHLREGGARVERGGGRPRERPDPDHRATRCGHGSSARAGNLGFTQLGRIEYALNGGRINTDFIDNSAGVDTSDHEVNLKILLGLAIQRGELTLEERNELLEECADDVVRHVLYDNYLQAQILSQEMVMAAQRIESYEDLMIQLEDEGELEREVEFLPSTGGDAAAARGRRGHGAARARRAARLREALDRVQSLLDSDLPDSPYLARGPRAVLPAAVVERFGHLIGEHPLRRELIATIAANDVVNSQGITFVSRMVTETGARRVPGRARLPDRARRHRRGRALGRRRGARRRDRPRDPEPADDRRRLDGGDHVALVPGARHRAAPGAGRGRGPRVLRGAVRRHRSDRPGRRGARSTSRRAERLVAEGVPSDLARRHAFQGELVHGPDIISVAHATGRSVLEVARGFFLLGERLQIDWLEQRLEELPAGTRWQRWAQQSMEDDLFNAAAPGGRSRCWRTRAARPIDEAVDAFLEAHGEAFGRLERFMRGLAMEGVTDLAQLTVALRQIRSLLVRLRLDGASAVEVERDPEPPADAHDADPDLVEPRREDVRAVRRARHERTFDAQMMASRTCPRSRPRVARRSGRTSRQTFAEW